MRGGEAGGASHAHLTSGSGSSNAASIKLSIHYVWLGLSGGRMARSEQFGNAVTTTRVTGLWGLLGWRERPRPIESCLIEDGDSGPAYPTDLYCSNDHFVLQTKISRGQWGAVATLCSLLILAGFYATAQRNSAIPVDLVYVAIGMALVSLPLRHFPITCSVAVILTILGDMLAFFPHFTGQRFYSVCVAAVIVAVIALMAEQILVFAVQNVSASLDKKPGRNNWQPKGTIAWAISFLTMAEGLAVVGYCLRLGRWITPMHYGTLSRTALISAAVALGLGLLVAVFVGSGHGLADIRHDVPSLSSPPKPGRVTWKFAIHHIPRWRTSNAIARTAEILIRVVVRSFDIVCSFVVGSARITTNLLRATSYFFLRIITSIINRFLSCSFLAFAA